jgi:para-aminobenzoate synthetase component 1
MGDFLPLVEELSPAPDPEEVFLQLCGLPHCLFLDSALNDPTLGRYSFIAADPFDYLELPVEGEDCLAALAARMADMRADTVAGLPPFQGGAAGLLGYDLGRQLEVLPAPACDEFQLPAMAVGFYDVVVAFDQVQRRCWIISQGLPETGRSGRRHRAEDRLGQMRGRLTARHPAGGKSGAMPTLAVGMFGNTGKQDMPTTSVGMAPIGMAPIGNHLPQRELTSNFSKAGYLQAVGRVIEYIGAGDVFQVNVAQRLLHPARDDSVSLYRRLRRCNPAPFAGYFDLGEYQIVSASPERFLRVTEDRVQTRPIKGTCRRAADPAEDRALRDELVRSEKDRAENVMIVDLLRNDLSRVCRPGSVRVEELCRVETYEHVHHLVSAVSGRLREGCGPIDLVRASFPGGSITGAPKIRAMEIIAELEPTARGAYCGSLGYLGFDGSLDLSILIRTVTAGRGWWQAPVGGGIVADSSPEREYEETWNKAEGLLRAFGTTRM